MTLNKQIYQKIKEILYKKYSSSINAINLYHPSNTFYTELVMDSLQMYELMDDFEQTFKILIHRDDIDDFIIQNENLRSVTIQNAVDYIEKQIIIRDNLKQSDIKPSPYIFLDANHPLSPPRRRKHSLLPRRRRSYVYSKKKLKKKYKITSNIRRLINKEAKEAFAEIPIAWTPRKLKARSYCKYFMYD